MSPTSATPSATTRDLKISECGCTGLLVDSAYSVVCERTQERFWALGRALQQDTRLAIREVVTGVNNLLIVFDALSMPVEHLTQTVLRLWDSAPTVDMASREIEIPVEYGGPSGEDLPMLAAAAGMSIQQWVNCHSDATYRVACVGSMPGFAYLSGLPAALAFPRRQMPRNRIAKGAVIIGGPQAGVMPCAAPSGWHLIGHSDVDLFNPLNVTPCRFAPGDVVRFVCKGIDL